MTFLPNHILISVLLRNIMQLESKNPWYVAVQSLGWDQLRIDLEEHVGETATKVGSVNRGMAG
jgi:hypothetical protein